MSGRLSSTQPEADLKDFTRAVAVRRLVVEQKEKLEYGLTHARKCPRCLTSASQGQQRHNVVAEAGFVACALQTRRLTKRTHSTVAAFGLLSGARHVLRERGGLCPDPSGLGWTSHHQWCNLERLQ